MEDSSSFKRFANALLVFVLALDPGYDVSAAPMAQALLVVLLALIRSTKCSCGDSETEAIIKSLCRRSVSTVTCASAQTKPKQKAVVIGAGPAGTLAAMYLAKRGYQVLICIILIKSSSMCLQDCAATTLSWVNPSSGVYHPDRMKPIETSRG